MIALDENASTPAPAPADGHGRAALLLVESLIHSLVAGSALTAAEAVAAVQIAMEAQTAILEETDSDAMQVEKARRLLLPILRTFEVDVR
jgi:hypothetical protein